MSNTIVETTSGNETTATVTLQPVSSTSVTMYEQPTVYVNLVYTAAVAEETEVWWCDNWRMLWNNQTRVLWQTA